MPTFTIVLLVITAIIVGFTIFLYFLGKRADKKRVEQEADIAAAAQTVSMLIIDKKKLRLKDAGLPDAVVANTPWYGHRAKLPIVKAKVGPRMMNLICDVLIYDMIPVKKEVKATVSGLYITAVKGVHGKIEVPAKKKGLRARLLEKARAARK